jgi:hypothetical protein
VTPRTTAVLFFGLLILFACGEDGFQNPNQPNTSTPRPRDGRAAASPGAARRGTATIGVYRPSELTFYLRNVNEAGDADITVAFGTKDDVPVTGDWDGNGTTTVGVYRPADSTFHLRNENSPGEPSVVVGFGMAGDLPVVGDWDGNGTATVGVFRPDKASFLLRNSNAPGDPDVTVALLAPGGLPVVGDWDGNATATAGIFRTRESKTFFRLRNSHAAVVEAGPNVDIRVDVGEEHDLPVAGDWDGNGTATIGVYRPASSTFLLRNANTAGEPDVTVAFGRAGDLPVAGNWDGK